MSILRRRSKALEIGVRVQSIKVGRREAFDGIITGYMGKAYHVADENGDGWHRERDELIVIEDGD